ncbi:hypothetical protein HYH03_008381 [Edaphochlamys debaryana]|uniref:Uncharacterized protein n=1 Tax=Edaphochlamys debaryana TaxID=47281 RepID=A0A836BZB8_9CHLO|nr:hypothetical protein HYH03_008381 [Edaphochlamys debaryana]|eukprot:KAG2493243.1 hypothetical protein HYH03_008381 [Edaphochlamys debaryana]
MAAAAGREHEHGSSEGTQEYLKDIFLQSAGQHNVLLADTIFSSFVSTNLYEGRRYTLDQLLNTAPSCGHARYFKFEHVSITYLATVKVWHGPDGPVMVLKLPNNGFRYMHTAGEQRYRHKCGGWVTLAMPAVSQFFPALFRAVKRRFVKGVFFYNFDHQRMDVQFRPEGWGGPGAGEDREPALEVNFEPGYPYTDDMAQVALL